MIAAAIISAIISLALICKYAHDYKRELNRIALQRAEYLRAKAMQFPSGSIKRVAHLYAASQLEAGSQSHPANK